jgi:hypothetical protein
MSEIKLDANSTVFFARELEYIKAQSYDVLRADLGAREWIPLSAENAPWANSITYTQYEDIGMAKWIASYADDLPRCDVKGKQFTVPVRAFGNSYGWNVDEIVASNALGKRLESRKALASAAAYRDFENTVAWFAKGGTADGGITGFIYNSNIPVANAPTGTWLTATPDQIIADVGAALDTPNSLTKGKEKPDTLLMGISRYNILVSRRVGSSSEKTILQFLKESRPTVTFAGINELDTVSPRPSTPTVGGSSTNILLAYKRDPMKLTLETPRDYTTEAPEKRNLEYVVNVHGKTAGVIIYYPLSCNIVEQV